ncbi:hypothetical protein A2331_04005 [Candidatus Falkowbacteria bacterium RIFOXYB2_FULL_34_18]|uniref:Calcineurin-like phosphoesterase domain-containing protein n=1 Tax=Candidatus Falkowbacteria bacterium RIFOXYD2_FULL_34_120 TaxID=1798007 RepID=A0A1F5TPQ0_9BACT|nr:MAG: hypothetical protein A2331_04005 [Candidatus Falkowbacteria bacterium RIFOXYB2_FULL_34_18]OGF29115.1 MAG: hypothetical protein A2500_03330 [Candidatus Falkowbacteria bacterium RIFOXYC12_FULL_34_55]OGF36198.1 MAG: hypothetical protein A2466_04860 [Candidatus Falkowbacteria bacterium RIFOXYC2_FULL_34_220]OGF38625.1 MAG: hypothetical protein A2515_02220 [Candidatus Falkowbacteria bacterium RIFOXYD12_FULL_34_57]OGF40808.1 MAG: hypothetical protein A2531_06865 [Candidatus Falkowbacteria bact
MVKKDKIRGIDLIRFLSTPKTLQEISAEFGRPESEMEAYLEKRGKLRSYNLFVHRNDSQKLIYVYDKEKRNELIIKPRVWTYRKHEELPYLWISFPNNLNFKKIILAPISDAHYGSLAHISKKFDDYLNWIARSNNVFGFLVGDEVENCHADSPPGAIFEQMMRPKDQIISFRKKLAPLAHKILFGVPGNHEGRGTKKTDIDPLYFGICEPLGIPYFDEPVFVDILWKTYVFTMYCRHGSGNAQTKGGKINKALQALDFQEHIMFNIMGHVHDPMLDDTPRICRERNFDEDGNLESFRLVHKKQYTIICPSFLSYFGSYGARMGFSPPNTNITTCEIYPNGKYHATS